MGRIPDAGADGVVAGGGDGGRARHGLFQHVMQFAEEGRGGLDLAVAIQCRVRGHVGALDGPAFLDFFAGQVHHQLGGLFLVARIFRYAQLPAAQGGALARLAGRQQRHAHLVLHAAVGALQQVPHVVPVAHEGGIAVLEHAAGFFLAKAQHGFRGDGAHPLGRAVEGAAGFGHVDADLAGGVVHEGAAAVAVHPFEGIAGQALIGLALPDIAAEIGPAALAFALLHHAGGMGEFLPGLGHGLLVFVQQVLAVVEQAHVGKPGQGHQPFVHGVVLDEGREVLLHLVAGGFLQVQQVFADLGRPDRIHDHHVHVGGAAGEHFLVEIENLGTRIGDGQQLDGVARLAGPFVGQALAAVVVLADGATGNGEGGGLGKARAGQRHGAGQQFVGQTKGHRTSPRRSGNRAIIAGNAGRPLPNPHSPDRLAGAGDGLVLRVQCSCTGAGVVSSISSPACEAWCSISCQPSGVRRNTLVA